MEARLVALLRGINVGRSKRVAMAQLRELLARLGYRDVVTYLQSGNAVFTCSTEAAATAAAGIEAALLRDLGVRSTVIVRTAAELVGALAADPLVDLATDPARHLVGFLALVPDPANVADLAGRDFSPNEVRVIGQHVYLWCPEGIMASPFATLNWERTLGVAVTMRNWSTATRLAALAGATPG